MTEINQRNCTNLVQQLGNDLRDALNNRYGEASIATLNQAFNACMSLSNEGNTVVNLDEVERLLGLEKGWILYLGNNKNRPRYW